MNNRTAIVFGATGLVGKYLVEELIQNMGYTAIKVFTRRKLDIEHIKVIEHVVDVEKLTEYENLIRGDDLYICLGTTMKKAGNIKRYEALDRDMPISIAQHALKRGIKRVAVVSAIGANLKSRSYYNRIKGEMEAGLEKLKFETHVIARPSLLLGDRSETRVMEKVAIVFSKVFSFIFRGRLAVYRAIHGRDVAIAMINLMYRTEERSIFLSHELKAIADSINPEITEQ